jgi:hypothetical protein
MKKLILLLCIATLLAVGASTGWQAKPLDEKLMQLHLEALPALAPALGNEPAAIQAILLEYADDEALLLKAQAALLRRPVLAREILALYGHEPEFREILLVHGDSILLPIDYFLKNRIRTLELRHYANKQFEAARQQAGRLFTPESATEADPALAGMDSRLTPEQRGWYAVNFIREEGHRFLGQFALDSQGQARWIQTERLLGETSSFFLGGIRTLETKARTDEPIGVADLGWAAVDFLVVTSTFKILRIGKAAAVGSRATAASRLAKIGRSGARTMKYGAALTTVAVVYVAARHPSLVNDALAAVATMLNLPVLPFQIIGWILLLLPLLYMGTWLLRFLLPPVIFMLRALTRLVSWLDGYKRKPMGPGSSSHKTRSFGAERAGVST